MRRQMFHGPNGERTFPVPGGANVGTLGALTEFIDARVGAPFLVIEGDELRFTEGGFYYVEAHLPVKIAVADPIDPLSLLLTGYVQLGWPGPGWGGSGT